MIQANEDIKWLYGKLKGNGYDIGSEEDFSLSLQDEDNRKWYYEKARKIGLDVRSMDDFNRTFAPPETSLLANVFNITRKRNQVEPYSNNNTGTMGGLQHVTETTGVSKSPVADIDLSQIARVTDGTQPDNTQELMDKNRAQVASMTERINKSLEEKTKESQDKYDAKRDKEGFWLKLVQDIAQANNDARVGYNPALSRQFLERNKGLGDVELQQDFASLNAAKTAMKNAQRIIDEADHNAREGTFESSFLAGAGRGLGQHLFDVRTWDMGLSDFQENAAFISALNKFEEGTPLSDAERDMLDAKAIEMATNAYFGSYVGHGYKAGSVTAESIPFMLEMAINPASAIGKTAQSKLVRYALQKFGKESVKKSAAKYMTAKVATRVAGDIVGAATMAATTGSMGVAADAFDRMGGIKYEVTDDGNTAFGGVVKGDSAPVAIAKAFVGRTIENHSEMLGNYFSPIVNKAGKGLYALSDKLGLDNVRRFMDDVAMNDVVRLVNDFENRAQWNGTIGEFAEEIMGGVENAILVGDQTLDTDKDTGVFNADNMLDTFLGVSLMGGFMSSVKTVGYVSAKYEANKRADEASAKADAVIGNEWGGDNGYKAKIQECVRNGQVNRLDDLIVEISHGNPKKRKAVMDYVGSYARLVGAEKGDIKRRTSGEMHPIQQILEAAFDSGYNLTSAQDITDAVNLHEYRKNELLERLSARDVERLESSPQSFLKTIEDSDADLNDNIIKYLEAKAAYDGLKQKTADTKESETRQNIERINSYVNTDTGQVIPATMKVDDRKVYVIHGRVVELSDKTGVDVEQSDDSIIIRDAETGVMEQVSPKSVLHVNDPIDTETLRTQFEQEISARIDTESEAKEKGLATFNPGDTYNIKGEDAETTIQIVADGNGVVDNGNGTVNVTDGNKVFPLAKAVVQEQLDRVNKERVALSEQQRIQKEEAIAREETEADSEAGIETEVKAVDRIPRDESDNLQYEAATPGDVWDAMTEQSGGDIEIAADVVADLIKEKEKAVKDAGNKYKTISSSVPKAVDGSMTIEERIAQKKAAKELSRQVQLEVDKANASLAFWQRVAGVPVVREQEEEAERRRIAEEAAALRKAEEERLKAEREEAKRIEREALNGVPDMVDDKPQDARARGYRRMNGHKIDRQEPVQALQGKEVSVKFSDDAIVGGRIAVIDANLLQPSHVQGVRNPLHFIDEAQPKERNDEASVMSARKIAANIRPEEITSSVTAYTGAPTVNARGEVIQGNNRSDALRQMWAGHPEQAGTYKQYLKDHAEEFGLQAEDVEYVEHPVLVNMVDVDDAEAINLGQYVAQDTESGGIERIKPKNIMQKMGNDMRSFANLLLASSDEEISFAGLVDANGANVLKWMMQKGYITSTQYSSAFDSKGNLTAEAKNDLRGIMYQSIFKGGSARLEEMFNALPVKAQKAILATAYRDYDSPNSESMLAEIQDSIRAFHALMQDPDFAEAKNWQEARLAAESWKIQYAMDDVTGESYLPAENFSNFAILLATMYKGEKQSFIQSTFNKLYDLIQGTQEENLFEQPDNTPRTLVQAIKETLNIDYDGQHRSNVLGDNSETSQRGQRGSDNNAPTGERDENGKRTADSGRGADGDSGRSGIESEDRGNQSEAETARNIIGRSLNADEVSQFIAFMENTAQIAPELELTPQNWANEFGEDGTISTPIGDVKQGDNQYLKLAQQGRNGKLGMVKPTLEHPSIIIEDKRPSDNSKSERDSSYVFVKTFIKKDGSRYYYFASITVKRDSKEVVISSQERSVNRISKLLQKGKVTWIDKEFSLHPKSQIKESVPLNDSNRPTSTDIQPALLGINSSKLDISSANKDRNNSRKSSELGEKVAQAESETDVNPTDRQKETGNYKKGHVRVGVFDITIEQPKGSVRSGVDANGNKWETTMQNTYGYIRGTEGVDGDHIDVFLSDDIDGWDGRSVFVVDQYNEDGTFDEHKVMLGFNSQEDAETAYVANHDKDWAKKHKTVVTPVALEGFEKWIASSHRKTKAFAEYKRVKNAPKEESEPRLEKVSEKHAVSAADAALRDALVDKLRESGIEVVTDSESAQRVLDEANGKVRTMAFGEEYDYDQYPNGRVEPGLADKTVQIEGAELNHGFANFDEAREWAKKHIVRTLTNEESGGKGNVKISSAAVNKYLSESAVAKSDSKDVHLAVLKKLPEVIRESIDVETTPDFKKDENGKRSAGNPVNKDVLIHRCYGAVEIDGNIYRVKITLKEYKDAVRDNKAYSYETTKIELLAGTLVGEIKSSNPGTNNSISVANLLKDVGMSYNPGVKVLEESKKRSENLREHRVYHGSGADHARFFRTANGEAYGFTVGGKIYLDPKIATAETPIHEYAHLWADVLRRINPEEWKNVVGLMKDTPIWDEVKELYPSLETDDEIADEVLAHYSGRRGAERLRDAQQKVVESKNGIFDKTTAIEAIERVKEALTRFWKGVADFLGIHFTTAEEVADKVLADLLTGVNPMAADGKGRSLAGIHNISEEKIGKALKMGGLANPSVAVMDMAQGSHEGYGEISLITPSALIDKKTGGNAGTFSGDAWTPTYPHVERQFSEDGSLKVYDDLSKLPNEVRSVVRRAWDSYMDGRDADGLAYQFLHEKGIAPEMREMPTIYSEKIHQMIEASEALDGDAKERAILDAYIESRFEGSREKFNDYIATRKRVLEKKIAESPVKKGIMFKGMNDSLAEINERGYEARSLYRFASEVKADLRRKGAIDADGTVRDAINLVRESDELGKEYKKWRNTLDERYGIKEVLFNGYTPDGNRKYLPHTLENVSKLMKKEGLAAATGWSGSFSKFAAGLMKNVGTLTAIRKQKERLTPDHDKVEAFRKKWEDVYFNLGLKLNPDGGAFDDTGLYRLEEVVTKSNPKAFAKKEYGVELADKDVQQMKDMVRAIREEYPAMYFETKFERPVGLDEFVAAVVPMDALEETKEALRNAGLKLYEYDSNKSGDRRRALTEAVQAKGVRFQLIGEKGAENLDKAEEAMISPFEMSEEEKRRRGDQLRNAPAVDVVSGQIVKTEQLSARKASEEWWSEHVPLPLHYQTEIGEVVIDANSIENSLAHRYGQAKLDAITSLKDGFGNAVYLGSLKDFTRDGNVHNHYFAYPIEYKGERCYVFCRALHDANKNGLYVHEVFVADKIKKGNTLQTAASQPHGGIALYKDILANVLDAAKVAETSETTKISEEAPTDEGILYREVTDQATLDRLNSEPTITVYRAMQLIDGGLRPPMSAKVEGKLRDATKVGVWEEAEERPELANSKGKFILNKGNGKSISAAYNPYIHTSRSPINDQFSSAWSRPELVVVAVEVPESELTSGYQAEKAKDSVGEKDWKSGPVGRELAKVGDPRKVILSRWDRVKGIVPADEVAQAYAEKLNPHGIAVPFNTVPPTLREALVQHGVKIGAPEKGNAGASSMAAYEEWLSKQDSYREVTDEETIRELESQPERMAERVTSLAEKLHLDNVEIVTDVSALEGKKQRAKGFFNKKTGKITVVIPNHTSIHDVEQTMLHESVAHYGLRKLFGKDFNDFLLTVFEHADKDVRRRIISLSSKHKGDILKATEEYLASLAEDTDFENMKPELWQKIKNFFVKMLHKAGLTGFSDTTFGDNELRYILWASYQNLTSPDGAKGGAFREAANIAKQYELKVGNYLPTQSATELDAVNAKFNEELRDYNNTGTLPTNGRFNLGYPSKILLSTGFPDLPIMMRASLLNKKAGMERHPFIPSDLFDLVKSLSNPIAVFSYSKGNMRNVIIDLTKNGKNFLVGITLDYSKGELHINSISGLFPKENHEWIKWIQDGKAIYINQKEKVLNLIDSLRTNPEEAERIGLNLSSATKIVKDFENPRVDGDTLSRDGRDYMAAVNAKFNEELKLQIDGSLPEGHIYQLGMPSDILLSTSIPYLPIQMSASRLKAKATSFGHDFDLVEIRNIVNAIQKPIAIFAYGKKEKAQNLIVEIQSNGKNFVVGLSLKPTVGGKILEINSIRNVFPKDTAEWLNWIPQGKALYIDKKRIQNLIDQQRTILADVGYLDLDSVTKIVKEFENPSVADSDDLFRNSEPEGVRRLEVRDEYEDIVKKGSYQSREAFQDSMLSLKKFMEMVAKKEGKNKYIEEIPGYENAYIGENRLSSTNRAETVLFENVLFNPLLETITRIAPDGQAHAQLIDYMMAKHGLERNLFMAERDAERAAKKDGGDKQAHLMTFRQRDYAGLTALTDTDNVQDAENIAQMMVADYESIHDTGELWDKVNAVTRMILQKQLETGMMNKDTYDMISGMYSHYIPLRGFDEKTSDKAYGYLTRTSSAFNAPIKKAKGRRSKADDPIANLKAMAESAIIQGNRNQLVKQRFLNFALNHPTDLVSINSLWLKYNDVTDEWEPVEMPQIGRDATPGEVEAIMKTFESKMEGLSKQKPDKYKNSRDAIDIPYKVVDDKYLQEHQILVKRDGKDYILTVNGNPRLAQAVNGLTNPDNDVSQVLGVSGELMENINRYLSDIYTTKSPDFVASNYMRDMVYTNSMVWIKESPSYSANFHRNYAKANIPKMKSLYAKFRKNTLDMSVPMESMFYQFMMNGGETGYVNVKNIEQHKKDIEKALKKAGQKLPVGEKWDALCSQLDEFSNAVENSARFAAFMTSREMGRSIDRAIYDAKEISVNFNKKGSGMKFVRDIDQTLFGKVSGLSSGFGRSLYIFWNAAIQGLTNFGRQAKRHPAKMLTGVSSLFLLGIVIPAMAGDDDDEEGGNSYFDLPSYLRRSNIMFKMGDKWVSIPLPVEYRAIYGMGELAMSVMSGAERMDNKELLRAVAEQTSQILPLDLMSENGLMGLYPSAIKPLMEVKENVSWTGLPIYKDTPFNKKMPEWTKAYKNTNKHLVDFARYMNEIAVWDKDEKGNKYKKGDIDINPAIAEHLIESYFGGLAKFVNQMGKTIETVVGEREFDVANTPIVNRLVKTGDERTKYRAVTDKYFKLKEQYDETKRLLRSYEHDTYNGIFNFIEEINDIMTSDNYRLYQIFEIYKPILDDLYEDWKSDNENGNVKAADQKEQLIFEVRKELVEMIDRGNARN